MNKQRLTKITAREILTSSAGGAIDDSIPEQEVRKLLSSDPKVRYAIDELLPEIRRIVGYARLIRDGSASSPEAREIAKKNRGATQAPLEPREMADQASDTAAVIDELLLRLHHLAPHVDALAHDLLFQAGFGDLYSMRDRIEPDLHRLASIMRQVASTLAEPARPGPRQTWFTGARADIVEQLRTHGKPRPSKKAAVDLAVDILDACGLPNPRK